jgi:hypothetical protein
MNPRRNSFFTQNVNASDSSPFNTKFTVLKFGNGNSHKNATQTSSNDFT